MLATTRRFAKSWVAAVLVGLLIVSLAIFQTNDVFGQAGGNAVIKGGGREVTQIQFRQIVDRLIEQNAQQTGQRATMQQLVDAGQHTAIMESMANREGLYAWVHRVGLRPARALIADQIRQITAFFDPVTGQFDPETQARVLSENGLTPPEFEEQLAGQLAADHFVAALAAGFELPRVYGAVQAGFAAETRTGRYMLLSPSDLGDIPAPTDAQLTALQTEFADQLRQPERRTVSVVSFTPNQMLDDVEVTDAEIQERFAFSRDTLGAPETRSFVTLTAPNAQVANTIAGRLRAGEDPAAVGASLNIEPVSYQDQPRAAVADARLAQAAFGLASGAVSGPVQADLGLVVIKVTAVTPGRPAVLADHREQIRQELALQKATARVSELVERFDAARQGGASLTEAARQVGVEVTEVEAFSADGALASGQPLGLPEVFYQTAFDTAAGSDSDIVDLGQDNYFALRVNEVIPARLPSVDEMRAELTSAWRGREINRRMRERADAIAARVRGGEDIAAVARAEGLTLVTRQGVGRDDGEGENAVPLGVLEGLFGQGRGQVFSGPADREGRFAIGVVDQIVPPTPALAGRLAEQARQAIMPQLFQGELLPAIEGGARTAMEVRTYPDNALRALGIDPAQAAASEAAEGAPGGASGDAPAAR